MMVQLYSFKIYLVEEVFELLMIQNHQVLVYEQEYHWLKDDPQIHTWILYNNVHMIHVRESLVGILIILTYVCNGNSNKCCNQS